MFKPCITLLLDISPPPAELHTDLDKDAQLLQAKPVDVAHAQLGISWSDQTKLQIGSATSAYQQDAGMKHGW